MPPLGQQNLVGYAIGTILHGNTRAIGNLWIITENWSLKGSLLYDGKSKLPVRRQSYKQDTMSLGMKIASRLEIEALMGPWVMIPLWAAQIASIKPMAVTTPQQITLPIGAMQHIQTALGITPQDLGSLGLTKSITIDETNCHKRDSGMPHVYQLYFGFTENYEYCVFCDNKKAIAK